MKEDDTTIMSQVGPDLSAPPHVLPLIMELFVGARQQALSQQKQLLKHLATCHYCRTAVMVLLSIEQEYDRRNNDSEQPAYDLIRRFVRINDKIEAREAHEIERMGAYAEAIKSEGREKATQRFPDIAAHVNMCSDCCSALEATVAFITEAEEIE